MKPSNEEKARFFAQYWGQRVFGFGNTGDDNSLLTVCGYYLDQGHSSPFSDDLLLRLKPLSSISDEDSIEVAKIVHSDYEGYAEYNDLEKEDGYRFLSDIYGYNETSRLHFKVHLPGTQAHHSKYLKTIQVSDYLRSKGYAIPWNGHTVEKMIEWGWINLTK